MNTPTLNPEHKQSVRLLSLDAYRGIVMLLLAFTAAHWDWMIPIEKAHSESTLVQRILEQFEHVEWEGLVMWDLIQPSFMFMVGVSMAYSYVSRERAGQSYSKMLLHAIKRALILILLGVFLRSLGRPQTYWTFEDVVTQIGLGYVFLFLLWRRTWKVQLLCALILLLAYWCLFAFWPLPGEDFQFDIEYSKEYYTGFFAHWNMNTHPGHYFDLWLLNLFPCKEPFIGHPEGYNTLNFIPSLSTMIFGLMAGELLRSKLIPGDIAKKLLLAGFALVVLGLSLHYFGICPNVKKIWTPSFGLISTGLSLFLLTLLYTIIDILKWQKWAFPAVIVGRNSIAMYCMTYIISAWLLATLQRHLGTTPFQVFGTTYQPLVENLSVGVSLWLVVLWMERRKLYLRI